MASAQPLRNGSSMRTLRLNTRTPSGNKCVTIGNFATLTPAVIAGFLCVTLSAGQAQTASRVPRFDIAHACRTMAVLPDIEHGQNRDDDVKHCVETEFDARKQLETEWSRFTEIARTTCLGISSVGSVSPVYSELMACLERISRSQRR